MMDNKVLNYDKLMTQVMSTYKTKTAQFEALKQVLYSHFNKEEAERIAKQKMTQYNPNNKSGKSKRATFVDSVPLLKKLDETIAFIDDWNFTIGYYKNVFIPQITYYRQLTVWTCGPACMRMILETLINEKLSENELIKILNTNPKDGTLQKNMISIGNNNKYKNCLEYSYSDYGTLTKLTELTKNG
eukprot:448532_1